MIFLLNIYICYKESTRYNYLFIYLFIYFGALEVDVRKNSGTKMQSKKNNNNNNNRNK
jgi:hypothetical protein